MGLFANLPGYVDPVQQLRDRPRLKREERENVRTGKILRGRNPLRGKYLCPVCGFCCMHHDTPACEHGACWIRIDDADVWKKIGWRQCALCPGGRGFMLDFTKPGCAYDAGRARGVQASNFQNGTGTMEHLFVQEMQELRCL